MISICVNIQQVLDTACNLHERAKNPAQNPMDFDQPEPEERNDTADGFDYDAAFQKDADVRGLCALENLIRQLESVGPMSHVEMACHLYPSVRCYVDCTEANN